MFGFPKRRWYGLVSLIVVLAVGCGDDATTATGSGGSSGGGTGSTGGLPPTSTLTLTSITADGTVTADGTSDATSGSSGASGDSTGETGDTTGGVVDDPGRTASQLVGAGQKMSSTNFSMVFTLGQPTQVQSTHSSTNYRLQGGLVGANGAPP